MTIVYEFAETVPNGPVTTPPTCSVWVNGSRLADGQVGESDDEPVVLTNLRVVWGRASTLDQPTPGTCSFTMMDRAGGQSFLGVIRIGDRVDVHTDGMIYGPPTLPMLPAAPLGIAYVANGTLDRAAGWLSPLDALQPVVVMLPPAALSWDPSAWNAVPRAKASQTWNASVTVTLQTDLGTALQRVEVAPVMYRNPNGSGAVLGAPIGSVGPGSPGVHTISGDFQPTEGAWVGLAVTFYPTGPAWYDVAPPVTWDTLPGAATRVNRALNPRAVSTGATGWLSSWQFGAGGAGTYGDSTGIVGPTGTGITTARRKTWTVAPTSNSDSGMNIVATATEYIAVTPGETITISVWARKTSAGVKGLDLWLRWKNQVLISGSATVGSQLTAPMITLAENGSWYRATLTATVPATGVAAMTVVADIDPVSGDTLWAPGDVLEMTGFTVEPGASAGSFFDGATPDVAGGITYSWSGAANASTSTAVDAPSVAWSDLARIKLDPAAISLTAPTSGVNYSALVFSGRVTDLRASYDIGVGATMLDVIVEDHTADLANRYVGDEPWGADNLGHRFAGIVALAGSSTAYTVDPGAAALPVSWRDVDSQPATRLLQELAISAAGVLWSATDLVSGPYLHLEDVNARPPLYILAMRTPGFVSIYPSTASEDALTLSACSFLLDPVEWVQASDDNSTRVAVGWFEQTLDNDGNQAPTGRTALAIDQAAEAASGRRRIGMSTQLSTASSAQQIAEIMLGRINTPGWRVSGLRWRMNRAEPLSPADLLAVMTLLDGTTRNGLPILLVDLPAWSPISSSGSLPLYLEGGRYSSIDGYWTIELLTSNARAQGQAGVVWNDLPTNAPTRINRAVNPRAGDQSAASGWMNNRPWGTGGNGTYSYATVSGLGNVTTARRRTWTVAPTSNVDTGFNAYSTAIDATTYHPCSPGEVLTVSAYLRPNAPATAKVGRMRIVLTDRVAGAGANVIGGVVEGADVPLPPAVWTRVAVTFTVPAGVFGLLAVPDLVAGGTPWAVGHTLDGTGLLIEKAPTAGAYFDGASADVAGVTDYGWTGTPNASASRATDLTGWSWDEFDPAVSWAELAGVGI